MDERGYIAIPAIGSLLLQSLAVTIGVLLASICVWFLIKRKGRKAVASAKNAAEKQIGKKGIADLMAVFAAAAEEGLGEISAIAKRRGKQQQQEPKDEEPPKK